MRQRLAIASAMVLAGVLTLATVALADDGSIMQRLMGHESYAAMVQQMRGALGDARADQMLRACDEMMASAEGGMPAMPGGMMGGSGMAGMTGSGMAGMMGASGMGGMAGR